MSTEPTIAEPTVKHTSTHHPLTYERIPDSARTDPDMTIDDGEVFWIAEDEHAGEVVATIHRTSEGTEEATARLFTAAPDLLEALRDVLEMIAADRLIPESVSYMRRARAAIAKAEGRAL